MDWLPLFDIPDQWFSLNVQQFDDYSHEYESVISPEPTLITTSPPDLSNDDHEEDTPPLTILGMSGDMFAFTFIYVSMVCVTFIFIGVRLVRYWLSGQSRACRESNHEQERCRYPACNSESDLPYSGNLSILIPGVRDLGRRHTDKSSNNFTDSLTKLQS